MQQSSIAQPEVLVGGSPSKVCDEACGTVPDILGVYPDHGSSYSPELHEGSGCSFRLSGPFLKDSQGSQRVKSDLVVLMI